MSGKEDERLSDDLNSELAPLGYGNPSGDDGDTAEGDTAERDLKMLETERLLNSFGPRAPRLNRGLLLAAVQPVQSVRTAEPVELRPMASIAGRTPWYWPVATASLAATAVVLAVLLAIQWNAKPEVRVEYVERSTPAPAGLPRGVEHSTTSDQVVRTPPRKSAERLAASAENADESDRSNDEIESYLRDREMVLRRGVGAVGSSQPMPVGGRAMPPATQREMLRQLGPVSAARSVSFSTPWLTWPTE